MACIMIDEHNYFMVFYYLNFYEVPSKSSVSFPIKGKKKAAFIQGCLLIKYIYPIYPILYLMTNINLVCAICSHKITWVLNIGSVKWLHYCNQSLNQCKDFPEEP